MANVQNNERPSAYVRSPRPRTDAGSIDDFAPAAPAASEAEPSTTHDSGYTLSNRNPIQSRSYRRARSDQEKVRKELKYGQYLSVPKGSREIFASRERQTFQRRAIALIIVVAVAIILLLLFWPK